MILQNKKIDLSIILPCLNEENAIRPCLDNIRNVIDKNNFSAEVIIVDNASTDASLHTAYEYQKSNPSFPLIIAEEKIRGYGSAYQKGFSVARGKNVFIADLDGTYDFNEIPCFIAKINEGYDLVVGNRFTGKKMGSMPWHHQYIGNPMLSAMVRLFFGVKIKDIHCGARALSLDNFKKLHMTTRGMEFASEMIIKAAKANMSVTEIPIAYAERIGTSKLHSLRDGWRHTRFILLYSPLILFFLPGIFLFCGGLISMILLYLGNLSFLNITLYIHPMFFSSVCIIAGYQLIYFSFFAKTYAITHMEEKSNLFEILFKYITLERACSIGLILLAAGILMFGLIFYGWIHSGFGPLNQIKNSIIALTMLTLGIQTISSAFMLSIISIKKY